MAINQEDIIKYLEETKLKDLVDLVHKIEEHFGVSAAVASAAPAAAAEKAAPTDFSVVMTAVGANKLQVVQLVKKIISEQKPEFGLMQAKQACDNVDKEPLVIRANVKPDDAEKLKAEFVALGATIDLR